MLTIRVLPEPAPIPDARYQAAVDRRRAWAKGWVRQWYLRRAAANMGVLGASAMAATDIFRGIFATLADLQLSDEIDHMWDDALPRLHPDP